MDDEIRLFPMITPPDYLDLLNTACMWGSSEVPPHQPWEEYIKGDYDEQ